MSKGMLNDVKEGLVEKFFHVKEFLFMWKQGEALERSSYPAKDTEALGLGKFSHQTNLALNAVILYEDLLNDFCSTEDEIEFQKNQDGELIVNEEGKFIVTLKSRGQKITDKSLSEFCYNIARASGSSEGFRLSKTLETIAQIKPTNMMTGMNPLRPQPTSMERNKNDNDNGDS